MQIPRRSKVIIALTTPMVLAALAFLGLQFSAGQPKTEIKTTVVEHPWEAGRTTGANLGQSGTLKTASTLEYVSPETETQLPKANAITLQWDQQGGVHREGGIEDAAEHVEAVVPQVRTHNGREWTDWTTLGGEDDKKEGTPEASHSAIVLTTDAQRMQYRFVLNAEDGQPIEISNVHVEAIDATQGPDPDKKPGGLAGWLNVETASAATGGPRVLSRAEWGCPEATSSPRWTPRYYTLNRVMVHHTAATGAGYNGAAGVRAVWQSHYNRPDGNGNIWGDIGYNYLVDMNGTIYQGRYFDQAYAESTKQVVEAGHTLGFNDESISVSALGNFESENPSGPMNEAITQIAGSQMAVRDLQPWSVYVDEQGRQQHRLAGHRNYTSTACPGRTLYANLNAIRNRTTEWVNYFGIQRKYDYSYVGQTINGANAASINLRNGQTAVLSVDLKNEGEETWSNTGSTPIRLGTANPLGHNSGLAHSSWISPSRPTTFAQKVVNGVPQNSSTVAPGETARFTFTVQAPNVTATVYPYYQLVAENAAWFPRNVGVHFTINLQADTYAAQWLDQSYNVPTVAGQQATLNLTLKNNSSTAWTNTGDANTIRLGTDRPKDHQSAMYDPSWISQNRIATFTGKAQLDGNGQVVKDGNGAVQYTPASSIAPGEAAYFEFQVTAPNNTVHSNDYISPVVDGKAWMDNLGIYWPINVNAGYHAAFAGQSSGPILDKSDGGTGVMYFDFKNDGSIAWVQSGANPIRLGTDNPRDRISGFRASNFGTGGGNPALPTNSTNWLSGNRVQTFAGTVSGGVLNTGDTTVDPGQIGRFVIALDGRNIPNGTYPEYFGPVVEGVDWLFFGTWLPITVQN